MYMYIYIYIYILFLPVFDVSLHNASQETHGTRTRPCNTLQHSLQHTTTLTATRYITHRNTLQHSLPPITTTNYYNQLQQSLQHVAPLSITHYSTHCSTLQHIKTLTSTCCNTPWVCLRDLFLSCSFLLRYLCVSLLCV